MSRPIIPTPFRVCIECGKTLERKRLPNGDLEYMIHFNRRKFCNRVCMALNFDKRPIMARPSYATAHHHSRKMVAPGPCARCQAANAIDVHHKDENWRNNDPTNLERLCRSCHLKEHKTRGVCAVCPLPVKGLGYCEKHYQRFKTHGDPLKLGWNTRQKCLKCDALANAKGLCGKHYMQAKRARAKSEG